MERIPPAPARNVLAHGLVSLCHPFALASIALLLVNDHWLKFAFPSWLTGKLSDFAGLYFFPFLFATLLALVLVRLRLDPRTIGLTAFCATALGFVLVKLAPWANAGAENFLAFATRSPAQIVRDPTDLIALGAMLPAWRHWSRPSNRGPHMLAWLILLVAAFASLATSYPPPPRHVVRLTTDGDTIKATMAMQVSTASYPTGVAISQDGGITWHEKSDEPAEPLYPPGTAVVKCAPENMQRCYRVTGLEQVEQSDDGGKTFFIAWSPPAGRLEYRERRKTAGILRYGGPIEGGARDLAFIETNGQSTLVAAMGNQGVLVRTPDGRWVQRPVLEATPDPFFASNPIDATLVTWTEAIVLISVAFIAALVLSLRGWIVALRSQTGDKRRSVWWALRPVFLMLLVLLLLALALVALMYLATQNPPAGLFASLYQSEGYQFLFLTLSALLAITPWVFLMFALAFPLFGLCLGWRQVMRVSADPTSVDLVLGWPFVALAVIFPVAWLPFLVWAFGPILFYPLALLISALIVLGVFVLAWRLVADLKVTPRRS